MDVQERLDWLAKHDATARRFTPQPYVQLANVLRRQGFAGDAARVSGCGAKTSSARRYGDKRVLTRP